MPNYSFIDNTDGREFTEFFTISGKEDFLKENQNITQTFSGVSIVDPYTVGVTKTDGEFRSLLKQIKKNNIHSTIKV